LHEHDTRSWLKTKIEELVRLTESFINDKLTRNDAHHWSLLKLLVLAGWVFVYTTIIPKQDWVKEYWYVDLLAGSGAIQVKETGDIILGSPFVAHFFARTSFTKYFLVEMNKERHIALQTRENPRKESISIQG